MAKKNRRWGFMLPRQRELIFQDVKVPAENLSRRRRKGFKIAMQGLDGGRIGAAAGPGDCRCCSGSGYQIFQRTGNSLANRSANSKSISFMLADMATKLDAARLLVYRAASLKEQGKPCTKESCMAKLYATDAAMSIATDAITDSRRLWWFANTPVERLMRDAKITRFMKVRTRFRD